MRRALLSVLLALPLAAGALMAQAGTPSPHGDMRANIDCSACHTPLVWKPVKAAMEFDHARQAQFPLTGRHAAVPCARCHLDARFDEPKIAPDQCRDCHLDVHRGRLPDCASCHTTTTFQSVPAIQVHARTSFPLTGAHLQVPCESCHTDERHGAYAPVDGDCVSCHLPDYQGAQTVDHVAAGFPTTCRQCHSTVAWTGGVPFDHVSVSGGFVLAGAHGQLRCASCHVPPSGMLKFVPPPSSANDCVACHQQDYNRQHAGSGFPTTCADCHNVNAWDDAHFDHTAVSGGFALLGAHQRTSCDGCHIPPSNQLRFTPSGPNDCIACHQQDFTNQHGTSGIPTTCLDCHTVDTWSGATFDHAAVANGYALVGAHQQTPCSGCHIPPDNQLRFTPSSQNDCAACHQSDYDAQHAGSGFPLTCLTCHTVDSWTGGTFTNHDAQFFPIYSGKHNGQWGNDCSTCHNVAGNYTAFTCLQCHTHNQTETDGHHSGISGYAYTSTACYSCHANGRVN